MTATMLLDELRTNGVHLTVKGEHLAVDAPKGVLTDDLRQAIRQHKAALLTLLTPRLPRHRGGMPVTRPTTPCPQCGSVEWQEHITYRYCRACGWENQPPLPHTPLLVPPVEPDRSPTPLPSASSALPSGADEDRFPIGVPPCPRCRQLAYRYPSGRVVCKNVQCGFVGHPEGA